MSLQPLLSDLFKLCKLITLFTFHSRKKTAFQLPLKVYTGGKTKVIVILLQV
nr:MAG TPA: hypothetical protein [Caudoviricetes sp.]